MNKRNKILVGCLALLLVLSVGYALFSETIEINGTATAKGSFDIEGDCELITQANAGSVGMDGYGYTIGGTGTCTIENGVIKTTSTLTKPSDEVLYSVTLTNKGTIPAKLKTISSPNNTSENMVVDAAKAHFYLDNTYLLYATYEVEGVEWGGAQAYDTSVMNANIVLQPNESKKIIVCHTWLDSENLGEGNPQPAVPAAGATMNYNITIGFEQVTN